MCDTNSSSRVDLQMVRGCLATNIQVSMLCEGIGTLSGLCCILLIVATYEQCPKGEGCLVQSSGAQIWKRWLWYRRWNLQHL